MTEWIEVCGTNALEPEDVIPFDYDGASYAIYRARDGRFFATDGLCTHEQVELADGLVMGTVIECPMHNGRFDITTGKALCAPVTTDLKTYPVKTENDRVFIGLG
jgi:3-phenylpropionate/trans-cinnamate dioxygenase ferredoxin subunit